MKKLLSLLALLSVISTANAQSTLKGDMNDDGSLTITDVAKLVEIILNGSSQSYLTCPDDNHPHMIDLGLPSGTKWACCNVGASAPEENGGYYAWGETEEKDNYELSNYEYSFYEALGEDISGTQYDVAHVMWGGSWVMPSYDQIQELLDNCPSEWTILNGVNGRRFSAANGGNIFLPAAGYHWHKDVEYVAYNGYYWSSTQDPSYRAFNLVFDSNNINWDNDEERGHGLRRIGRTIRPVWVP